MASTLLSPQSPAHEVKSFNQQYRDELEDGVSDQLWLTLPWLDLTRDLELTEVAPGFLSNRG